MSKPQPAQPANPQATATAQTGSNIDTAIANRVNQVTPYGSTTYANTGSYTDPTTGQVIPTATQTTSLNPLAQSILTGTENTASSLLPVGNNLAGTANNVTTGNLNLGGNNNNTIQAGPQALDPTVANAVYNEQSSFLDPQWNEQQRQLQSQLSQGGIPVGSEAYNNAMTNFNNSKTQAYNAASNNAISQGAAQANNMYGLAIQGQNQNINQQTQQQSLPLSLIAQLYGSGSPATASGVA